MITFKVVNCIYINIRLCYYFSCNIIQQLRKTKCTMYNPLINTPD